MARYCGRVRRVVWTLVVAVAAGLIIPGLFLLAWMATCESGMPPAQTNAPRVDQDGSGLPRPTFRQQVGQQQSDLQTNITVQRQPTVLIVGSYGSFVASTALQERGVREAIGRAMPLAAMYSEYLLEAHTYRMPLTDERRADLAERFARRVEFTRPDLVVTIDTLAFQTATRLAERGAMGVPVVFSGVIEPLDEHVVLP